jgi:hypothetical protein
MAETKDTLESEIAARLYERMEKYDPSIGEMVDWFNLPDRKKIF